MTNEIFSRFAIGEDKEIRLLSKSDILGQKIITAKCEGLNDSTWNTTVARNNTIRIRDRYSSVIVDGEPTEFVLISSALDIDEAKKNHADAIRFLLEGLDDDSMISLFDED